MYSVLLSAMIGSPVWRIGAARTPRRRSHGTAASAGAWITSRQPFFSLASAIPQAPFVVRDIAPLTLVLDRTGIDDKRLDHETRTCIGFVDRRFLPEILAVLVGAERYRLAFERIFVEHLDRDLRVGYRVLRHHGVHVAIGDPLQRGRLAVNIHEDHVALLAHFLPFSLLLQCC